MEPGGNAIRTIETKIQAEGREQMSALRNGDMSFDSQLAQTNKTLSDNSTRLRASNPAGKLVGHKVF